MTQERASHLCCRRRRNRHHTRDTDVNERASCQCPCARRKPCRYQKKNGLSLTDAEGEHHAQVTVGTADELANADVLFLCAKAQDLESMAEAVQPLIHSETLIVPFVNGIPWWYFQGVEGRHAGRTVLAVDPRQRLKRLLPGQRVIGAVTTITAERLAPGVARTRNPLRCVIGEIDHRRSDRTDWLAALLADSGIATRVAERIRDALWTKVIANLCSNPLSVVTGATLRDVCGDPSLSIVSRQLVDEGLLVAASFGARLELDPSSLLAMGASMGDFKTSMLQDYEKAACHLNWRQFAKPLWSWVSLKAFQCLLRER